MDSEDFAATPDCIREVGEIARAHELTAMIEFARTSTHLATLPTALRVIREAAHPSVRPMLDFFHFYSGLSKLEDLDLLLEPGQVTALVGRLGGVVIDVTATGRRTRLVGHLPSTHVPELTRRLPDLTGGEAVLVSRLGHYAPSTGDTPPVRRRRGPDPADRDAWFRDVPR